MSEKKLTLTQMGGTLRQCGRSYGEEFKNLLHGFSCQCNLVAEYNLAYAKQCWAPMQQFTPRAFAFFSGLAEGAGLTPAYTALFCLHEEIFHLQIKKKPHCSALALAGPYTACGQPLIGQNWDWDPSMFAWGGLLHLKIKSHPSVLTYHYPGLPTCCGINSAGLAIMWTGGGYFSKLQPIVGVPTYALLFELFLQKSALAAINLLAKIPHAGFFNFLLADASGDLAAIEAAPTVIKAGHSEHCYYRSNLYLNPSMVDFVQEIPPSDCLQRSRALARALEKNKGCHSLHTVKKVLASPQVAIWKPLQLMTIDRFVALPQERLLFTCRAGAPNRAPFWGVYEAS